MIFCSRGAGDLLALRHEMAIPPADTKRPGMSNEPAVEVENLVRRFGDHEALSHVSLTIRKGEFFSLLEIGRAHV